MYVENGALSPQGGDDIGKVYDRLQGAGSGSICAQVKRSVLGLCMPNEGKKEAMIDALL